MVNITLKNFTNQTSNLINNAIKEGVPPYALVLALQIYINQLSSLARQYEEEEIKNQEEAISKTEEASEEILEAEESE